MTFIFTRSRPDPLPTLKEAAEFHVSCTCRPILNVDKRKLDLLPLSGQPLYNRYFDTIARDILGHVCQSSHV